MLHVYAYSLSQKIRETKKSKASLEIDLTKKFLAVNFSFFSHTTQHTLEITGIYSHAFLATISWKQRSAST